jgi:hypothetical protein
MPDTTELHVEAPSGMQSDFAPSSIFSIGTAVVLIRDAGLPVGMMRLLAGFCLR